MSDTKKETEKEVIETEGIGKEQAREWEEKLFQKELVRAKKRLRTTEGRLKVAKVRVQYWEERCKKK